MSEMDSAIKAMNEVIPSLAASTEYLKENRKDLKAERLITHIIDMSNAMSGLMHFTLGLAEDVKELKAKKKN